MIAKPNGGPAYPIPGLQSDSEFNGMSLRDAFAIAALTGICSYHDTWSLNVTQIAATSYELADAMLAERAKS